MYILKYILPFQLWVGGGGGGGGEGEEGREGEKEETSMITANLEQQGDFPV